MSFLIGFVLGFIFDWAVPFLNAEPVPGFLHHAKVGLYAGIVLIFLVGKIRYENEKDEIRIDRHQRALARARRNR